MRKRKYTLGRRALRQEETRQRIVEAAIALHQELGPREASITAIAERAGVQRLTVYRHFPDDVSLFGACSSTWVSRNPPPDPDAWQSIADPSDRTAHALQAVYAYFDRNREMLASVYRDLPLVPAVEEPMRAFDAVLDGVRQDLMATWDPSPAHADDLRAADLRAADLRAALGHALRFSTWQSLHAEGLDPSAMAALVSHWITSLAGTTPPD